MSSVCPYGNTVGLLPAIASGAGHRDVMASHSAGKAATNRGGMLVS